MCYFFTQKRIQIPWNEKFHCLHSYAISEYIFPFFSPMIHELFLDHIMPQATCIVKFWSWHYFSIKNIVLLWPYVRYYNLTRCSTFPIYFVYRLHLLMYFVYNAILPMSSYILTKMFLAVVFPSIKAKEIKYSPKKGSTLYNYGSQRWGSL